MVSADKKDNLVIVDVKKLVVSFDSFPTVGISCRLNTNSYVLDLVKGAISEHDLNERQEKTASLFKWGGGGMFVRAEQMSDPYFRLLLEGYFNVGFKISLHCGKWLTGGGTSG